MVNPFVGLPSKRFWLSGKNATRLIATSPCHYGRGNTKEAMMPRFKKLAKALWYALRVRPKYVILSGIRVPVKLHWIIRAILFEAFRFLKEWLNAE